MGFSSCTDLARFFTKTQCCSQAEAYPALGNRKNTFQKKRQVRSTDVAILLVSSSGEELKAAHRRAKLQKPSLRVGINETEEDLPMTMLHQNRQYYQLHSVCSVYSELSDILHLHS